jgi:vancomycin permeability regulator SanA
MATEGGGSPTTPSHRRYWVRRVAIAIPLLVLLYLGVTFIQVWRATGWDATHHADSIVVLGAAQYNGTPSPTLQARLDHALVIWKRGMAGTIVLTGSKQPVDRFTEAYSGFRYLRKRGVP